MKKLCIFTIIVAAFCLTQIESVCKMCNSYGFACVNRTHYRICNSEGVMLDGVGSLPCGDGQFCTDQAMMCAYKGNSSTLPACSAFCDICEPGKIFACTGIKSFARCNDGEIDDNSAGTCPGTTVCDTRTGFICVQAHTVDTLKCDRNATYTTTSSEPTTSEPTIPEATSKSTTTTPKSTDESTATDTDTDTDTDTTTTAPTTTTTTTSAPIQRPTEESSPEEVCQFYNVPGRYPYNSLSTKCSKKFVNCRYWLSKIIAQPGICPFGLYYDKNIRLCQFRGYIGCDMLD